MDYVLPQLRPPPKRAILLQIPGFPAKHTAAGAFTRLFHRLDHRPAGVQLAILIDRMPAGALTADLEAGFILLVSSDVDAQCGLGDAPGGMGGGLEDVQPLAERAGLRWQRQVPLDGLGDVRLEVGEYLILLESHLQCAVVVASTTLGFEIF